MLLAMNGEAAGEGDSMNKIDATPALRSTSATPATSANGMVRADSPAAPLASWNDGATKNAILQFVKRVSTEGGPDFVPISERIAVFDNDGTLWAEQPLYFQFQFAIDRVKALAPQHPEWKSKDPFRHLLAGDMKSFLAGGENAVAAAVAAAHSGVTTEEFAIVVKEWLASAKHPQDGRRYLDHVYQPMIELLDYLRASGFKPFIVSGGGVEFIRAFAESAYGIPPEQVIGSQGKLKFETRYGTPVLIKLPEIQFVDDGPGKPAGIQTFLGRRPIAAFGNSDGDLQMLQWTTAGSGPRLGVIVRHTDAQREWAYDRQSRVGKLDQALDHAATAGWTVVDMKRDWKVVFPETHTTSSR